MYTELVVFILEAPLPVPDIRVCGITCVPVWNVSENTETGNIEHSPLTKAIHAYGTEMLFANMRMEYLDLLYPGDYIFHQLVCLVSYEVNFDMTLDIEEIVPLSTHDVKRISAFAQEGIYG